VCASLLANAIDHSAEPIAVRDHRSIHRIYHLLRLSPLSYCLRRCSALRHLVSVHLSELSGYRLCGLLNRGTRRYCIVTPPSVELSPGELFLDQRQDIIV